MHPKHRVYSLTAAVERVKETIPDQNADAVWAGFGTLGIVEDDSVTPIRAPGQKQRRGRPLIVTESGAGKR